MSDPIKQPAFFATPGRIVSGSVLFLILLIAWVFLSAGQIVDPVFLPSIPSVFESLLQLFGEENYLHDLWISTWRVMAAFILSAALAIPLGMLVGRSIGAARVVEPFLSFVRYLPIPAFVPLCILWFGLGDGSKIALIFLGTFFQLVLMVVDVVREIREEYVEIARTLGAQRREILTRVLWPASLPGIVNACRTTVGWAWTYLVVAEIAGATSGLGYRILEAQRFVQTADVFAGIVIIGVLGVVTDLLFAAYHRLRFRYL